MTQPISDDERDAREDDWAEHQAQCPFCEGRGYASSVGDPWDDTMTCPECEGTGLAQQLPL